MTDLIHDAFAVFVEPPIEVSMAQISRRAPTDHASGQPSAAARAFSSIHSSCSDPRGNAMLYAS